MSSKKIIIPFCKPDYQSVDIDEVNSLISNNSLEGGGAITQQCESILNKQVDCVGSVLVPSCTSALEIMALALNLQAGDEVIMPSFTFVSTANAIALRGATPVFVDIDESSLNIDPFSAEKAITDKTRAIMIVHYAGVACDMLQFKNICEKYNLILLEDAAQCSYSFWNHRALGSIGKFGAISYHHTKNISCGEGGALIINDHKELSKSKIIRDKGTNRPDFLSGLTNKYEWKTLGSSFLMTEVSALILKAQLEQSKQLTDSRLAVWNTYFNELEKIDGLRTPLIPEYAIHNAHIFHIRLPTKELRDRFVRYLRLQGIVSASHYVPLHLTPGGKKFGKSSGSMNVTVDTCNTLVRLPLYGSMTESEQSFVLAHIKIIINSMFLNYRQTSSLG